MSARSWHLLAQLWATKRAELVQLMATTTAEVQTDTSLSAQDRRRLLTALGEAREAAHAMTAAQRRLVLIEARSRRAGQP